MADFDPIMVMIWLFLSHFDDLKEYFAKKTCLTLKNNLIKRQVYVIANFLTSNRSRF